LNRLAALLICALAALLFACASIANAAPVLLAETLELKNRPNFQIQDYLVSEKLDGIRAIWDGKTLQYRSGGLIQAPSAFLNQLPKNQALDGELWLGYQRFEALSAIVRLAQPGKDAWLGVQYHIFELPNAPGSFTERAKRIEQFVVQALRENPDTPLRAIPQRRTDNLPDLERQLQSVLAKGGEGLMLHLASAPYITGRSDVLLKLKPWHDMEAKVVGHLPGKGQFKGQLGALRVQLNDGKRFSIGTGFSKQDRANPPPIGSQVTFRYRGFTVYGLPRFAVFLRVRPKE
jgi:DNA ligase 1